MAKSRPNPHKLLALELEDRDETKTEIAVSLGMTVEQLRHLETGRRKPTLTQAIAIEDRLEIPIRAWGAV